MIYIALFFLAAVYDALALLWIYYSHQNNHARACGVSMLVGAVSLITIGQGIQGITKAVVIVLGYGAGTFVTVFMKGRYGT